MSRYWDQEPVRGPHHPAWRQRVDWEDVVLRVDQVWRALEHDLGVNAQPTVATSYCTACGAAQEHWEHKPDDFFIEEDEGDQDTDLQVWDLGKLLRYPDDNRYLALAVEDLCRYVAGRFSSDAIGSVYDRLRASFTCQGSVTPDDVLDRCAAVWEAV